MKNGQKFSIVLPLGVNKSFNSCHEILFNFFLLAINSQLKKKTLYTKERKEEEEERKKL